MLAAVSSSIVNELIAGRAEPYLVVNLGSPVSKDVSRLVMGSPVIRQSVSPGNRVPVFSNLAITVSNAAPESGSAHPFSEWDSGSLLINKAWHRCPITVSVGARRRLTREHITQTAVFVGVLNDVRCDARAQIATLDCADAMTLLQTANIDTTIEGITYNGQPPSLIAAVLLDNSPVASYVDSTSFNAFIFEEDLERFRINYTVPSGTWWAAIQSLLDMVNASVRWSASGTIQEYKFRPNQYPTDFTLHSDRNLNGLNIGRPWQNNRNFVKVYADYSGSPVEAPDSPVQVTTTYGGIRMDDVTLSFRELANCTKIAAERLYWQAEPAMVLEIDAPLSAFVVELGDIVAVTDRHTGISAQIGQVFSKEIDIAAQRVRLEAMDPRAQSDNFCYLDTGQTLDTPGLRMW